MLALAGLGLVATSTSVLPASAATPDRHAVALSQAEVKAEGKAEAVRRARAEARLTRRILGAKDTAMRQRGDVYSYGSSGPDRFDCSGLVYYSYRRAGFAVPRTSGAQAGFTRRVAKGAMRAGDLMFFYGSGGVYHAGIFVGRSHGRPLMVHAPGSGQRVQVAVPWTSHWFGGTLRR